MSNSFSGDETGTVFGAVSLRYLEPYADEDGKTL
jgi:hypothetical protein